MKRLNNLYNNMISYSNISFVFNKIKCNCHNKRKIFEFMKDKNCNLIDILNDLKNENYTFSRYNCVLIHEKKYRIIMSETIRDKIVNHLVSYFILKPALSNLIDTNVATREGKGTGYAYQKVEEFINSIGSDKDIYVLKIDINKYFYNIDHKILFDMISKRIKDKKALNIINNIISLTDSGYINENITSLVNEEIDRVNKLNISSNEKNKKISELKKIPLYKKGRGLSIGCLTNQLLAIFFLSDIDNYIKEELKHRWYLRYMDDLYIFDTDKEKLKQSFKLINDKLIDKRLNINNKSGIYRLSDGINVLGYTYYTYNNKLYIKYNNSNIRKIERKLNRLYIDDFSHYYKSFNSYKGYFKRCNTNLYFDKYKLLEINTMYDKYKLVKARYSNYYVLIKYKKKYYSYEDDLKYFKKIINRKKKNNSFFEKEYLKIISIVDNVVILDGNDIVFTGGY